MPRCLMSPGSSDSLIQKSLLSTISWSVRVIQALGVWLLVERTIFCCRGSLAGHYPWGRARFWPPSSPATPKWLGSAWWLSQGEGVCVSSELTWVSEFPEDSLCACGVHSFPSLEKCYLPLGTLTKEKPVERLPLVMWIGLTALACFFLVVLGFELRAYTLSYSPSPPPLFL
jgi:hypothetical protein